MNLDEALKTIETIKKENKRLQSRVDYLEKVMHNDVMENYDEYESYFPSPKDINYDDCE
jgi:hypothetical protein